MGAVVSTLRKIHRERPDIVRFLAARMLYADGKTAILISGGVYAAGMMGWGFIEMVIYGIALSVVAVFGGFVGGWLDAWVGPKRAIQIEIGFTTLSLISMASFQRDTMFWIFKPSLEPVWAFPYFQTLPEIAYFFVVSVIAIFITAAYASSRTLMTRMAPKEMIGELFGIYALAGTATVWMGPLLVDTMTLKGNLTSVSRHGINRSDTSVLQKAGLEPRRPRRPRLARHGSLVHLHTPITASLRGQAPLTLAEALHPTPAVAGLPRREAMAWLRSLEPFERGHYAAPIGWIDTEGDTDLRVAIRSGTLRGRQLELTAGAGLVRGSHPERELQEVTLKLGVLQQQLNLPVAAAFS
jgi:hypothetical protein